MIMLSAVYQQVTKETPDEHVKDPLNRYYSHFSLQRLDAEQLRDSVLFVAGDLNAKEPGGPATPLGLDNDKRTVYAKVSRFRIDPFLQAFDFPNPTFTAEQRFSTNVPVQRLYFMNDPFVYKQAGSPLEARLPQGRRRRPHHRDLPPRLRPPTFTRRVASRPRLPQNHTRQARLHGQPGTHQRVEGILPRAFQFQRIRVPQLSLSFPKEAVAPYSPGISTEPAPSRSPPCLAKPKPTTRRDALRTHRWRLRHDELRQHDWRITRAGRSPRHRQEPRLRRRRYCRHQPVDDARTPTSSRRPSTSSSSS